MHTVTFYEIAPDCPSQLPSNLTEYERQLFDAINNAGAIDSKLLAKRSYVKTATHSTSLTHLQDIGAIEKRTVEVAD